MFQISQVRKCKLVRLQDHSALVAWCQVCFGIGQNPPDLAGCPKALDLPVKITVLSLPSFFLFVVCATYMFPTFHSDVTAFS